MSTITNKPTTNAAFPEHRYLDFVANIQRFARNTLTSYQEKNGFVDLYIQRQMDKTLFDIFLENLPEQARQHYNCNTCRAWFESFGSTFLIDSSDGTRVSPFWTLLPDEYTLIAEVFHPAIKAMNEALLVGKAVKPFYYDTRYTRNNFWGVSHKGGFDHMHFQSTPIFDYKLTCRNVEAAENEFNDKRVEPANRNLNNYSLEHFKTLKTFLDSGSLYNPSKSIDLYIKLHELRKQNYALFVKELNLANDGLVLIAGGIVGAALNMLVAGRSVDDLQTLWNKMVDPLKYQRQGSVTEGTIKQANKLIADLGLEDSLVRGFARMIDVEKHLTWKPPVIAKAETKPTKGGVFDKLLDTDAVKEKKSEPLTLGGLLECTFSTFVNKHLPNLISLEFVGKDSPYMKYPLTQLTTEGIKDSKPLFRYDKKDNRNPLGFYLYEKGSACAEFGLSGGRSEVVGIMPLPGVSETDDRGGVILLLKGAKDLNNSQSAIFPDNVLPELHSVRAAIEMYSRNTPLVPLTNEERLGVDVAAGYLVSKNEGKRYGQPLRLEGKTNTGMLFKYDIYAFA